MRYLIDESTYIFGQFNSGDTVTITVYKASDASVIVNAAACTHLASGVFKYSFSDAVTVKTEYLYIMTNTIEEHAGKIILGGYPDNIADSVLDEVVEGTLTMRQMLRLMKAFIAGKTSGGGTTSIKFRDDADGKNRITMTVDEEGNRSAVTLDIS